MAGYSSTPLPKKLGLAPGMRMLVVGAEVPYEALVGPLPEGARRYSRVVGGLDFAHVFVTRRARLAERLPRIRARLAPAGMIWVSWPKRAAQVETDVTEDVVRAEALPLGLVDVKVCAVDEVWSGLKLVIRRELR